jgi:glycosyltransferase involved in cell wall biosynthesis
LEAKFYFMESQIAAKSDVTLVGHPFASTGMGELPRGVFRALKAVDVNASLRDVYGFGTNDTDIKGEFNEHIVQEFSSSLNIFCLNGDEIEPSLGHLSARLPKEAVNIVYPVWELSKYPAVWAEQLNQFDEVWAASRFTQLSIGGSVKKPVLHMPLAGEFKLKSFLSRRYFGIPESSFVFLFFFDFTSYLERKNPFAALEAFDELCKRRPNDDLHLVIKIKGGETKRGDHKRFCEYVRRHTGRFQVIDRLLDDNETKNLLRCCDCFLSLHRSEGFGLGMVRAMYLGKPVVATGYSGNLDYMSETNSCLVRYALRSVADGAYPFAEGQVWAEPDISHAVDHMVRLVSDRDYGIRIGEDASRHVRVNFSYQAAGLRYARRIKDILGIQTSPQQLAAAAL